MGLTSPVVVDDANWPLVVTVMRNGATDADIHVMLARYDAMLRHCDKFVALVDLSELSRPPGASQRKLIADWSRARDSELSQRSVGYALIIPNVLVRGALTALLWLHRTGAPETLVPDAERGLAWCIERLTAASIPVGPQVRAYVHKHHAA